jgi:hypothetical protein
MPVSISVILPEGWFAISAFLLRQQPFGGHPRAAYGIAVGIKVANNLYHNEFLKSGSMPGGESRESRPA